MTHQTTELLTDPTMRKLGFTDHVKSCWYLCVDLGSMMTLNITIDKRSGSWTEAVLDEYFGQPAYYGLLREPLRSTTAERIEAEIARLNEAGLNLAVTHEEYGHTLEGVSIGS